MGKRARRRLEAARRQEQRHNYRVKRGLEERNEKVSSPPLVPYMVGPFHALVMNLMARQD